MAALKLESITKRFILPHKKSVSAVIQLSLEVKNGEMLVLLGPSGCGKTTTLRLISGLESPDEGKILIGHTDATKLPPGKRNVSLVFQNPSLLPQLTVEDNILLPRKLRKLPLRNEHTKRVIAHLGLEPLLERHPETLSGGQLQRAALARALVLQPDLILLDEPLANLDPISRRELRSVIRELHHELKITTIYVTHDQSEAFYLGNRIALMNNGRIEQLGDVASLLHHPSTLFSAQFIGNGVNLLPNSLPEVVSAIRPEDILLDDTGEYEGAVLQTIDLGTSQEVILNWEGTKLRMITSPTISIRTGQLLRFNLPAGKLLKFEVSA
ncbi:MAG: ABC transporter ATP-binding protein [Verrucomicrobiota bacterium]